MKNYGELQLENNAESKSKIYFAVADGEVYLNDEHDFSQPWCGYVTVQYDGPYCGTVREMKRYLYNQVEEYLKEKGIVKVTGKHVGDSPWYDLVV